MQNPYTPQHKSKMLSNATGVAYGSGQRHNAPEIKGKAR